MTLPTHLWTEMLTFISKWLSFQFSTTLYRRHVVAQLVETLCHKPEGRGFDSQLCQKNFSFRPHYGPGVDSASNRNEYQEYFLGDKGGRCIGLTALPVHVLNVLKFGSLSLLETSGPVQTCNRIALSFRMLCTSWTDWSNDPVFLNAVDCLFLKVTVLANWVLGNPYLR